VVSLSGSLATWFYTWVYLDMAQKMQEASIFNNLYTEYSNPAMLDASDLISEFKEKHGSDRYMYEFVRLKRENTQEGKKLDHARRQIVRWYKKVKLFYAMGHIRWDSYGEVMPGKDAALFFLELFEPLVLADRVGMQRRLSPVFDWYRQRYNLNSSSFVVDEGRLPAALRQAGQMKMRGDEL